MAAGGADRAVGDTVEDMAGAIWNGSQANRRFGPKELESSRRKRTLIFHSLKMNNREQVILT
jgi:hypothetical protein